MVSLQVSVGIRRVFVGAVVVTKNYRRPLYDFLASRFGHNSARNKFSSRVIDGK